MTLAVERGVKSSCQTILQNQSQFSGIKTNEIWCFVILLLLWTKLGCIHMPQLPKCPHKIFFLEVINSISNHYDVKCKIFGDFLFVP